MIRVRSPVRVCEGAHLRVPMQAVHYDIIYTHETALAWCMLQVQWRMRCEMTREQPAV